MGWMVMTAHAVSARIQLRCTGEGPVGAHSGELLHGAFFVLAAPPLASELHSGSQRPFTLSRLLGRPEQTFWRVGETAEFRFSAIGPKADEALAVWRPGASFRVGRAAFEVEGVYEARQFSEPAGPPPRRLGLEFLSPTVFRAGDDWLPLPDPGLIAAALERRWMLAGGSFGGAMKAEAWRRVLRLSSFDIRTQAHPTAHGTIPGFTGVCRFDLDSRAPSDARKRAAVLAAFSLFAGVGAKTAFGMGQVREVR